MISLANADSHCADIQRASLAESALMSAVATKQQQNKLKLSDDLQVNDAMGSTARLQADNAFSLNASSQYSKQ